MKLLTWNVNHRAQRRCIPPPMAEALVSLSPDVIVLTEYVPGPCHEEFVTQLASAGFVHVSMSAYTPRENHILIVSQTALEPGTITGPPIAPSVPSNVLHVRLPQQGLDVLGIRIPDYSRQPAIRRACWDWLEETARAIKQQPFVLLGDFNTDPEYPPSRCGDRISKLVAAGWQHAAPSSGASYLPVAGGPGKRLDHAFVSEHFMVRRADYIWASDRYTFAGKKPAAMSDHAALIVEIVER